MLKRITLSLVLVLFMLNICGQAFETENHTTRILPAPGKIAIDGKTDDWDLSGGTFACRDVKRFRDHYAAWLHLMYDADYLYVLARWKDPTPLNNDQSSKGGYGFKGDCLQFRMIFNYQKPGEKVNHFTCWRDVDGILMADLAYGRKFKSGNIPNITAKGGKHAVALIKDDPKAYVQELAIPWKLIAPEGWTPKNGASFRITVEPNFTAGAAGRISVKDLLYNPLGAPDRIFTFRAYKDWAEATVVDKAPVKPQPLVMASGDEFTVTMKDGKPVIDWSPLFKKKELPGHKKITFDMPFDGNASLVIKDKDGVIVRHLLNDVPYQKGKYTVKWDGLATPMWRTPTDILPSGQYTWEAIAHKPYKLVLRGWADCQGVPWNKGNGDGWGGDHGAPTCIAPYEDNMIMGWDGSEAGFGMIAADKKGRKRWHVARGPTAGHPHRVSVDGDEAVGFDKNIFKINATNGRFGTFTRNGKAFVYAKELWQDAKAPKGEAFGDHPDSLDVKDGVIYLGFADATITKDHVRDWKKVAEYLRSDRPFAEEILPLIANVTNSRPKHRERGVKSYKRKLKQFIDGKIPILKIGNRRSELLAVPKKLTRYYLNKTDLFPGSKELSGVGLRAANREWISKEMGNALKPIKNNFILMLDRASGNVLGYIDVPMPTYIRAVSKDLLYVISDEREILAVNQKTGKYKSIVKGKGLKALTVDPKGNLVVAIVAPDNQIVVYNQDGKELRRIGQKGGRPVLGPWQKNGLINPWDVAFDSSGRLWVMERDRSPKRVSVWDYAKGECVDEFFGPTHYGASGGAINPLDPNVMISSGVEYRIDKNGRGHAQQVVSTIPDSTFSTYAMADNGRLYWIRSQMQYRDTPQIIDVFEKLKDGSYKLRADITRELKEDSAKTVFWSDANDDGKRDANEIQTAPLRLDMTGRWWLSMDAGKLTLITKAGVPGSKDAKMQAYKVKSYTKCGAPVWDVKHPQDLSYTHVTDRSDKKTGHAYQFGHMMASLDNKSLLSHHSGAKGGSREALECFDFATGKRKWWYPKKWNHVHGGHRAPPPEPGLIRAAYGIIGSFVHPLVGNVWVINTDKGEWHMISEAGFFVGTLFETDAMSRKFPDQAIPGADMTMTPPGGGGEDFGGSVIQAKDGKVYMQSGKIGAWNLSLEGLDSIKKIGSGKLTIEKSDIVLAKKEYESQKQSSVGKRIMEIAKKTVTFSGNPGKDFGRKTINYQKGNNTRVRTWAAYDDKKLYLAYDVQDPTPWVNGAGENVALYQGGDTVDFQLGTDPRSNRKRKEAAKGDLRLSVGNFQGKPTAVLYRKVWDEKKPREFTSGVIKSYIMDYVAVLKNAEIKVNVDQKRKFYIVEVAVPLDDLGLNPDKTALYKADFGVTHGDTSGQRTALRTHWCNQQTGLVNDAVFELMMSPQNWGEIKFK